MAEEKKKYDLQQAALVREKEDFDNKKKRENELFQERLDQKVTEERKLLEEKLKQKMLDEQKEQFEMLQKELKEKSAQIQELNKSKAEIEKLESRNYSHSGFGNLFGFGSASEYLTNAYKLDTFVNNGICTLEEKIYKSIFYK